MATLAGARALGREQDLGSITAGKLADMVAVDLSAPECQPVFDSVSQLVYAAGREHVTDVWVGGRRVMNARSLANVDVGEVAAKARQWATRIRAARTQG